MAKQTKNRKLTKPLQTEAYDVDIFNANYDKIDEDIGDLESITLDEETEGAKSITFFIKYILNKIKNNDKINALINAHKKLLKVIKDLRDADNDITATISEYKASVDEYSTQLGIYVDGHEQANNKLNKLLNG